ncbi:hypothetical protein EUBVEN_00553 [Eubacterium ventriosum ATCC 27560]|uniref:Uncharacterized protein n=1 Tax=Eubacterium ventriosum ATCC 27560 TaxID=411463 RepID=A5Z4C8_9FIRM|nr:hypothetical protein EUBVEN_00553 [Eubacterium ventriosum ATCC 27560]
MLFALRNLQILFGILNSLLNNILFGNSAFNHYIFLLLI